ncbi:hypothetical protein ANO11243_055730 [Dothideomycetidae sp. 11243]|nr:hypothetical protein ANO11243_055730 [fungal sp. No.11243]
MIVGRLGLVRAQTVARRPPRVPFSVAHHYCPVAVFDLPKGGPRLGAKSTLRFVAARHVPRWSRGGPAGAFLLSPADVCGRSEDHDVQTPVSAFAFASTLSTSLPPSLRRRFPQNTSVTIMKCAAILAGLCAMATASPFLQMHEKRQAMDNALSVVETAIYNVSNQTVTLTGYIKNFQVNYEALQLLQLGTNQVIGAILAGEKAVAPIDNLTTSDVIALSPITNNLVQIVNTSITATIAKKQDFGGLAPVIYAGLKVQQQQTLAFAAAVAAKIPPALVSAALAANQPIFNSVAAGVEAFSVPNVNKDPSLMSNAGSLTSAHCWRALAVALVAVIALGST